MIIATIAFITAILASTGWFMHQKRKKYRTDFSGKDRNPNLTNYNMEMLDPEEIENMTPEEAKAWLKKVRESGSLSSLPHRDFFALRKKLKQTETAEE